MKKGTFLLLCVGFLFILFSPNAASNPIPINTNLLWLTSEDITIEISQVERGYIAEVKGVYPFRLEALVYPMFYHSSNPENNDNENIYVVVSPVSPDRYEIWENVDVEEVVENLRRKATRRMEMMFPVPSEAENISIEVLGENVEWKWADNKYSTELGDFPMVEWAFTIPENMISARVDKEKNRGWVTSDFTVRVEYAHLVTSVFTGGENDPMLLINEEYVLLYALGTGRYMGAYKGGRGVTARIETRLPEDVEVVDVRPTGGSVKAGNKIITTRELGWGWNIDYVLKFTSFKEGVLPPILEVSNLTISGEVVRPGENLHISVDITNHADEYLTPTVTLLINGKPVDEMSVFVGSGWTEKATFTLSENIEGAYDVNVMGLTGSFVVKKPFPWAMTIGTIAVIAIILGAVFYRRWRS